MRHFFFNKMRDCGLLCEIVLIPSKAIIKPFVTFRVILPIKLIYYPSMTLLYIIYYQNFVQTELIRSVKSYLVNSWLA